MARLLPIMALFMVLFSYAGERGAVAQQEPPPKPNIVMVLTDDMRADDVRFTPKVRRLVGGEGMTFENAFVTDSVCCPSRATFLTGLYAHNHNVKGNYPRTGSVLRFNEGGHDEHTVAAWLDGAGYQTGLFGNYMKSYNGTYVPPGWDEWQAWAGGPRFSDNGRVYRGAGKHFTDFVFDGAEDFVASAAADDEPFFAYLAPQTPHPPANPPAGGYSKLYPKLKLPRDPAFNERDLSDKPDWLRSKPLLNARQMNDMDLLHRKRARSLRALDDRFEALHQRIEAAGELENTYFIFTSDNGFHMGEHRMFPMKQSAYEEDIKIPLLISGPDVERASEDKIVLNNDFAPTLAELSGAEESRPVDGRSYAPLLRGENPSPWRSAFLIEKWDKLLMPLSYKGIRTNAGWTYVEYGAGARGGQQELYNVRRDPHQINNLIRGGKYGKKTYWKLNNRLEALSDCEAQTCVRAEN